MLYKTITYYYLEQIMKRYLVYLFIQITFSFNAQEYQWTGNANSQDFFNELNWKETTTDEYPPMNSINPEEPIQFNLYITCNVVADGEINLEGNIKITIVDGELYTDKITGIGQIILNDSAYLIAIFHSGMQWGCSAHACPGMKKCS